MRTSESAAVLYSCLPSSPPGTRLRPPSEASPLSRYSCFFLSMSIRALFYVRRWPKDLIPTSNQIPSSAAQEKSSDSFHRLMVHPPPSTQDRIFIVVPDTWTFPDRSNHSPLPTSTLTKPVKQPTTASLCRSQFMSPAKHVPDGSSTPPATPSHKPTHPGTTLDPLTSSQPSPLLSTFKADRFQNSRIRLFATITRYVGLSLHMSTSCPQYCTSLLR